MNLFRQAQMIEEPIAGEKTMDAVKVMADANKIIEDFSTEKYVIYAVLFLVEAALCFWVALKLL
jgi:hypothetical protein